MEAIKVCNLSFAYPEAEQTALNDISMEINVGEFITVCGPSGSGKSTLLRLLKPALSPHGSKTGSISFFEKPIDTLTLREQSSQIGFVQQSPDNQIVTDKVWHELAFGLESLGLDNGTIRRRVAETASFFGISEYFEKSVSSLSGGQKQLLNLASVMAMQPEVLILDEPTSQLDPIAAADFLACVLKINRELGTTVIITEHRLEEILPASNRVAVLDDGKIISYDTPLNTGINLKNQNSAMLLSLPAPMRIWDSVCGNAESCPVTVAQGRAWLDEYSKKHPLRELDSEPAYVSGDTAVSLKNIWFRYDKNSADVIKDLSLNVNQGEFLAILGGNGAGKSTLLSVINGINKPYSGKVNLYSDDCMTLPQNPTVLLNDKNVLLSLYEMFEGRKTARTEQERRVNSVIKLCRLEKLIHRHPFDLSGGEQQRAALAKILLLQPKILLLDEPTKGLDNEFKETFAQIVTALTQSGAAVIMVSHDIEFCAKYTHRCIMLFNGEAVASDTPRRFFSSNSFYVTSANRMSRGIIDNAVTAEDVIYCCTGQKNNDNPSIHTDLFDNPSNAFHVHKADSKKKKKLPVWKKILGVFAAVFFVLGICVNVDLFSFAKAADFPLWADFLMIALPIVMLMISLGSQSKKAVSVIRNDKTARKIPKRTIAASVMILFAVPITIFIGTTYLQDQRYLFISLLVLLECMTPFFLIFEGRKPQARELVIIAVLCAITIAGRSAFIALPQIKPVIALVIISGASFGAESGFIVGAVAMLVSNIYFGQGAWTPWQMFAAGIIGFLSGILFKKGLLSRNRGALCIYGFIVTILIYGLIMNFSTIILTRAPINSATLIAYYMQGFPMDIIHAFSTLAVLYFAAEPMLEKLDRVKTKYGLMC